MGDDEVDIPLPSSNATWGVASTISTTQHSVIADSLVNTGSIWDVAIGNASSSDWHGASPSNQQNVVHQISTDYFQPYSQVWCILDGVQGLDDQRPVAFPLSFESNPNFNVSTSGFPVLDHPSLVRASLFDLLGSEANYVLKWVDLPKKLFNGTSIGAIVVLPPDSTNPTERTMVVCNLSAGWGSSSMNVSSFGASISPTSSFVTLNLEGFTDPTNTYNALRPGTVNTLANDYQAETDVNYEFSLPTFPQLQIDIDRTWAEYLNPYIPTLNSTVINVIMQRNAVNPPDPIHSLFTVQRTLCGLLTNGLARIGFTSQIQGSYRRSTTPDGSTQLDINSWLIGKENFFIIDPNESKNWVKLRVDSTIEGFAYNLQDASAKVAVAFLLTYCIFALLHVLYAAISGKFLTPSPSPCK